LVHHNEHDENTKRTPRAAVRTVVVFVVKPSCSS